MHLPNGSYITFGGNGAIGPGGNVGSVIEPGAGRGAYDATYQDYDGTKAIRILSPCTGLNSDLVARPECGWWYVVFIFLPIDPIFDQSKLGRMPTSFLCRNLVGIQLLNLSVMELLSLLVAL
jgi:hypothetical protein